MPVTFSEPKRPAYLRIAVAVAVIAFAAWGLRDTMSEDVRVGREYRGAIADAYAAKLLAIAGRIENQHVADLGDIAQAGEDEFLLYRRDSFDRLIFPRLAAAAGNLEGDIPPERRAAVAKTLREIARGLSPHHKPLPPRPEPDPNPAPPSPPIPRPTPPDNSGAIGMTGWIDNPIARAELATQLPATTLSEAAPDFFRGEGAETTAQNKDIFLYRAWKDVLGDYPHYPSQEIGDCTSFGSSHALDLLQCIDIQVYHLDKKSYQETCTEATYGFSREVAGLLHTRWDGSYGVSTGKALMDHGTVSRVFVGGGYSGQRAKQWGLDGCPQNVRDEAAKHRLGGATLVTTTEEADAALANGYPFIVCSNQGFTTTRDETGTCYPRGLWAHCMFVAGRRVLGDDRVQYLICQSWGDNRPTGPKTDDQPDFSFWCDQKTMANILSARDSVVFSRFQGFNRRPIPSNWRFHGFAVAGPERPRRTDADPRDRSEAVRALFYKQLAWPPRPAKATERAAFTVDLFLPYRVS